MTTRGVSGAGNIGGFSALGFPACELSLNSAANSWEILDFLPALPWFLTEVLEVDDEEELIRSSVFSLLKEPALGVVKALLVPLVATGGRCGGGTQLPGFSAGTVTLRFSTLVFMAASTSF